MHFSNIYVVGALSGLLSFLCVMALKKCAGMFHHKYGARFGSRAAGAASHVTKRSRGGLEADSKWNSQKDASGSSRPFPSSNTTSVDPGINSSSGPVSNNHRRW